MFRRASLLLVAAVALASCSRDDVLVVRILPTGYEVADVRSELATPAVDEAVERNPREVHMFTCYSTPAPKVMQFQTELAARYSGKIGLAFLEKSACPA